MENLKDMAYERGGVNERGYGRTAYRENERIQNFISVIV